MAFMSDQASDGERHNESLGASVLRPPCFYKTVSECCVEGGPSCWMQVASAFVKQYLPHVDRMRTVLQNVDGATWPVQYMAEHGFVAGWAEFATGNALEIGDMLVFSFVEDAKFVVQVFGKSGCEKLGTPQQQRRDLSLPSQLPDHDRSYGGADRPSPDWIGRHSHERPAKHNLQSRNAPSRSQAVPSNLLKATIKRGDPAWGNSRSQKQARSLVTKARLRKMIMTPALPQPPIQEEQQQQQQQRMSKRKRSFGESVESDGASGYHGGRGGRSSLDSLRLDDEVAAADLRAFAKYGMNSRRYLDSAPPRRPGRPRKYPLVLPQDSNDPGAVMTVKRKRGRPIKEQPPGSSDLTLKPVREIYVSRRRTVTQAEKDLALNSAYKLDSQMCAGTTFIVVMRQSFVYRNFVLCVPRRFANPYMPNTSREVTLVDSAWNAWFCNWNGAYKYVSGRGWRNFALEHCLEEDDALLMEILEADAYRLTIKVHIFPVVPVPEGLTGWQSHVCPLNSCSEPNSGVPIDPIERAVGKIRPRLQCRIKRERIYSEEDSFTTSSDSSEEVEY